MSPARGSDSGLLDLVGELMGLLEIEEFRSGLLQALLRAVPSKWASLNEVGPGRVVAMAEPHLDDKWFPLFAELAHENPIYGRWLRTKDGRPYRFSDVTTREKLEATRLYREVYIPLGINHQIAFALPNERDHMLAVALSREDRDYTDDERDFLDTARPFLIQAYRNAIEHSKLRPSLSASFDATLAAEGLTKREAEVLRVVALGASNREAAGQLGVSSRTVEKMLERAYRKLGVRSRSEAVSAAGRLDAGRSVGRAPRRT